MSQINKRIYTSIILFSIFTLSFFNKYLLFFVLIFCSYQIFYEFYLLLRNIILNNRKILLYLILLIILFLLSYLILFVWSCLNSEDINDTVFLLLLITISIATDIGGFVFGKLFKGKKLTKISPNKTYSGMYGSFLFSIFICILIFKDYYDINFLFLIVFFISSFSQLGDLFISFLKRLNKVKDTGNLLPGHGGILDRFDGIIFSLILGSFFKILL
tara:strand:- start:90 stop:737 length:648 start_codon:yes stop_codon:yes gene_type:complete